MKPLTTKEQDKVMEAVKEAEAKGLTSITIDTGKKRMKRPCKRCGEMFIPNGKFCFICKKCCGKGWKRR